MSTLRTVYTNLRAARSAIQDVGRFREIVAVMVRHGFGHLVERWNLQDTFVLKLLVQKRSEEERKSLEVRIVEALQELGPTFVKLGQILSTRPDLIPPALCDQLKRLQDRVSPITFEEARGVLESSLGRPADEVFAELDPTPLASASIAQVHAARLLTGEEVVIKIQRPGIGRTIESDLNILYFVARQLEATIPELRAFDPVAIAREFEKAIRLELDFHHEASHLERFDRNFSSWTSVHIPRFYKQASSDRVLTIERLRGHKITEAGEHGHDMARVARECVRMLFKMVFEDGFFHGDLHPGNIFILDGSRIGLIDFGLVGRMTQAMKDAMADLLLAVVTHDFEGVARSFYAISIRRGKVDYAAFEADTIDIMERYFLNRTLAEVDFGAFLRDLVEGAIRHDVSVPPDYTMFFKAIMTVEGIGKTISPDLDLVTECRPYVERLVAERYSPERVLRAAADSLQAFGRIGRILPFTLEKVLQQLDDGRLTLGVEYPQLATLEQARDKRLNRAVLGALAGSLLLVGALERQDHGFTLFGLPGVTLVAWTVGGWLSARLLWRILRSGAW
jgi:ubiquinone biosynthesis protein